MRDADGHQINDGDTVIDVFNGDLYKVIIEDDSYYVTNGAKKRSIWDFPYYGVYSHSNRDVGLRKVSKRICRKEQKAIKKIYNMVFPD